MQTKQQNFPTYCPCTEFTWACAHHERLQPPELGSRKWALISLPSVTFWAHPACFPLRASTRIWGCMEASGETPNFLAHHHSASLQGTFRNFQFYLAVSCCSWVSPFSRISSPVGLLSQLLGQGPRSLTYARSSVWYSWQEKGAAIKHT